MAPRCLVLALVAALACVVLLLSRRVERYEGMAVRLTKKGRGMFATRAFKKGERIEACPLLVAPDDDWGAATADYVFESSTPGHAALALGQCSLLNHSKTPNVTYEVDAQANTMILSAARDIAIGQEMHISYGDGWWKSRSIKPS